MESSILKSDIFFFVTTICTILLTIVLAVAIIYGIKILHDLQYIVKKVKEEGDEILKDAKELRLAIEEKGANFFTIISSLFAMRRRAKRKAREEN